MCGQRAIVHCRGRLRSAPLIAVIAFAHSEHYRGRSDKSGAAAAIAPDGGSRLHFSPVGDCVESAAKLAGFQ
jgi:hypothetical protein